MNNHPLMKCGHTANSTLNGKPTCVICFGITEGYDQIAEEQPNLTNRKAKCPSCNRLVDSNLGLAFFEYRPNKEYDIYYCGCRGWD